MAGNSIQKTALLVEGGSDTSVFGTMNAMPVYPGREVDVAQGWPGTARHLLHKAVR